MGIRSKRNMYFHRRRTAVKMKSMTSLNKKDFVEKQKCSLQLYLLAETNIFI